MLLRTSEPDWDLDILDEDDAEVLNASDVSDYSTADESPVRPATEQDQDVQFHDADQDHVHNDEFIEDQQHDFPAHTLVQPMAKTPDSPKIGDMIALDTGNGWIKCLLISYAGRKSFHVDSLWWNNSLFYGIDHM